MTTTPQYQAELAVARRLTFQAGQILLGLRSRVGTDPDAVSTKPGNEPVSIADLASNRHICAGLAAAFPDDGVIAEESPDATALNRPRVWFVDPLDGTREYLDGRDDFAVMVGLAIGGVPCMGVVFQPAAKLLVWAAGEHGGIDELPPFPAGADQLIDPPTPVKSAPIGVSDTATPAAMRLIVSRSHRSSKVDAIARRLGIENELRRGSVGVKVTYLAMQRADLYVHPSGGTKVWDTCAPQAILVAAGGAMTDFDGEPLRYDREPPTGADGSDALAVLQNDNGFAASNGRAHDAILEASRQVLRG